MIAGMTTSLLFMTIINFYSPTLRWASTKEWLRLPGFLFTIEPYTRIAWTWYVLMGTVVCLAVGYGVSLLGKPAAQPAVERAGSVAND